MSHSSSCMLVNHGPSQRVAKKNTSHGNELLPQHTTHFIQTPCYRRGRLCQDPAGNRTTRRLQGHRKEMQSVVVWTCFPFIRTSQYHLARHSESGKKTRQTGKEVGRQHQEWTCLEFAKYLRAVENREKWRKPVVKLSVVPQRHLWVRDIWRWCEVISVRMFPLLSSMAADLCCWVL